jgi:uncharacterized protein (TIRG00374 family)
MYATLITLIRRFHQSGWWRMVAGATVMACYGYALKDMAWASLILTLQAWQWFDVGVLVVLNFLILGVMCWRWHRIVARMGFTVAFYRLMLYRIGGNAVSMLTPGPQFGGEPFQAHWLSRHDNMPLPEALASVTTDRLFETMANITFILVGGVYLATQGIYLHAWHVSAMIVMCLALLVLVILAAAYAGNKQPLSQMGRLLVDRWVKTDTLKKMIAPIGCCEERVGTALRQPASVLCLYGIAAVSLATLMAGELWLIYAALGVTLTPAQLIMAAAMARMSLWTPLPGALGALEVGQMIALTILGLDPVIAVAACVIMRARDLVLVGLGTGLVMVWFAKSPRTPMKIEPFFKSGF